jgi:purine nucleosidase
MKGIRKLILEHDGAIDDLLAQLLVLTMPEYELIGINVTPADCYIRPALESTCKILHAFGKSSVPVGRSDATAIHEFPAAWRAKTSIINALPAFLRLPATTEPEAFPEAGQLLKALLESSDEPHTILMTGPCTNLVKVLQNHPELKQKIESIIWMGGAFRTGGNVQTFEHDGSAEWNVFWDPISAQKLLEMELPLTCIPLDVTDKVPVKMDFLKALAENSRSFTGEMAGQFWALTIDTIPGYHYTYFMWDILAAAYLAVPEIFRVEQIRAKVSVKAPNAGKTMEHPDGHRLKVAFDVNEQAFYRYLLQQLK